jgi:hypothetical protein
MLFSEVLGPEVSFYDVKKKRTDIKFLRFKNQESRTRPR